MESNIKGIIEKIKKEGVEKAEEEAAKILSRAEEERKKIMDEARKQAEAMIDSAQKEGIKCLDWFICFKTLKLK